MVSDEVDRRIREKLAAPGAKSAWAKEKAAAEAKRKEDEAANAAMLVEFERSFGVEGDKDEDLARNAARVRGTFSSRGRGRGQAYPPNRFGNQDHGSRSAYGDYESASDYPQPSILKRKRDMEQLRERETRREEPFGHRDGQSTELPGDEPEKQVPKPTIHLSSLPPGMTQEQLKAILSPLLNVHSVRFMPPTGPITNSKRSVSAIATLASDTPPQKIDDAAYKLRDRYVGCGFTMSASRLPPNSNLHPSLNGISNDQPFGAQRVQYRTSLNNAPPPREQGRYAPPDSYDRRGPYPRESEVNIDQLIELPTIRAIHTIADRLLNEPDPNRALELEALLMGMPEVQTDERFAFLFDSKSLPGVYYRYCLWSPDALHNPSHNMAESEQIFTDHQTKWRPPTKRMPFAKLTELSDAIEHADYVSSDEESDDEGQHLPAYERAEKAEAQAKFSITPLQKARLTYLLARLPTVNTKLRKGDIARVTNFAITHAVSGIDEIVDVLLLNIEVPFALSLAAKYEEDDDDGELGYQPRDTSDNDEYYPEEPTATIEESAAATPTEQKDDARESDPANAKLVGLYVISDILSAIATAEGAKNAWKYRQLLERGFKEQKTFERLGALDRQYNWGRMKSEQWKRKIWALLDLWEKTSAFGTDVIKALKLSFNQDVKDTGNDEAKPPKEESGPKLPKWMSRITMIDQGPDTVPPATKKRQKKVRQTTAETGEGKTESDNAESMAGDESEATSSRRQSISSTYQVDAPAKHSLAQEDNIKAVVQQHAPATQISISLSRTTSAGGTATPAGNKRRMRAEDMFADSDEEQGRA